MPFLNIAQCTLNELMMYQLALIDNALAAYNDDTIDVEKVSAMLVECDELELIIGSRIQLLHTSLVLENEEYN